MPPFLLILTSFLEGAHGEWDFSQGACSPSSSKVANTDEATGGCRPLIVQLFLEHVLLAIPIYLYSFYAT